MSLIKKHGLNSDQAKKIRAYIDSLPQGEEMREKRVAFYKNLLKDKDYTLHFCEQFSSDQLLEENCEDYQSDSEVQECCEAFFRVLLTKKNMLGKEKVYSYLVCYCGDDPRVLREIGVGEKERAQRRFLNLKNLLTGIPRASFDKIFESLKKGELPSD